jgi:hypothetical protein
VAGPSENLDLVTLERVQHSLPCRDSSSRQPVSTGQNFWNSPGRIFGTRTRQAERIPTGIFAGSVDFGGGTLTSTNTVSDIFVLKLAQADGAHLWSHAYGGTGIDSPLAITVDAADDSLITGRFANTVNFGGVNLTSAGGAAPAAGRGAPLARRELGRRVPRPRGDALHDPRERAVVRGGG